MSELATLPAPGWRVFACEEILKGSSRGHHISELHIIGFVIKKEIPNLVYGHLFVWDDVYLIARSVKEYDDDDRYYVMVLPPGTELTDEMKIRAKEELRYRREKKLEQGRTA